MATAVTSVNQQNLALTIPVYISNPKSGFGNIHDQGTIVASTLVTSTLTFNHYLKAGMILDLRKCLMRWEAMGAGVTFDVGIVTPDGTVTATAFKTAVDVSSAGETSLAGAAGTDPFYTVATDDTKIIITTGGATSTGSNKVVYMDLYAPTPA